MLSRTLDEWDMTDQVYTQKELVGYPDWIADETLLNSYYQGLEVMSEDSYFQNVCKIKRFLAVNDFKSLLQTRAIEDDIFDTDRGMLITLQPYAFHNSVLNNMVVSLGFLREPFFQDGDLKASNYGSIGFILGHETGHSIVIAKRKLFNKNNDYAGVLNYHPVVAKEFIDVRELIGNQIQCFIDQYNNYKIEELNEHLNGKSTYEENIADYIGVTQAFGAYKSYVAMFGPEGRLPGLEQFSPEQIFFISFATKLCTRYADNEELKRIMQNDKHSVLPYRVNGAVSNSKAFSEHFKCPVNSPMNPTNKCTVEKREDNNDKEFQERLRSIRMMNEL